MLTAWNDISKTFKDTEQIIRVHLDTLNKKGCTDDVLQKIFSEQVELFRNLAINIPTTKKFGAPKVANATLGKFEDSYVGVENAIGLLRQKFQQETAKLGADIDSTTRPKITFEEIMLIADMVMKTIQFIRDRRRNTPA